MAVHATTDRLSEELNADQTRRLPVRADLGQCL